MIALKRNKKKSFDFTSQPESSDLQHDAIYWIDPHIWRLTQLDIRASKLFVLFG